MVSKHIFSRGTRVWVRHQGKDYKGMVLYTPDFEGDTYYVVCLNGILSYPHVTLHIEVSKKYLRLRK